MTYNRLNRTAEEAVLPAAEAQGLAVLAREPLANGYLGGKYRPGFRVTAAGDWRSSQDAAEVDARLEVVAQIAADEVPPGIALTPWALAWCLQHPAICAILVGSKTEEQLAANAAAADLALVAEAHPLAMPQ